MPSKPPFPSPSILSTPSTMAGALLPLSPSTGWQAGDVSSQADEEPDPQPLPGLPAEIEHLRANIQGQSINGDTGSPSLPGPDAQCNVLSPVCEGTAPGRNSRTPQSKAHGECECGCLFSQGLNKPHAGGRSFSLSSPRPPLSYTHTHTYTRIHTPSHTGTLLHPHTDISR